MSRYDWMDFALCATTDPDIFHEDSGGTCYNTARRICRTCPVKQQCAAHAENLEADSGERARHGLWASQSPRQRLAASAHQTRRARHATILRLHQRGGMNADEIAEIAGCDPRTVYRVVARYRDQFGEVA